MNVGIWRLSFFLSGFSLKKNVPERWNYGHEVIVLSFDNDWDPNEINPILKWFAMSEFPVLVENCLGFSLVWEWREIRVWKGCFVTRICTYT